MSEMTKITESDEKAIIAEAEAAVETVAAADPLLVHIKAFDLPGREQKLVITTPGIVALGDLLADRYLALMDAKAP